MVACLEEAGWTATVDSGGGAYTVDIPSGQESALDADKAACETRLGYDQPPEYTESVLRELYAKEVETAECLAQAGFPQPSEVPSEQQYLDTWGTSDSFFAYKHIVENGLVQGGLEWENLNEKCPQPTP